LRGDDRRSGSLFSYVDLEARVPRTHPLRVILAVVDVPLSDLSPVFSELYSDRCRPSIRSRNSPRSSSDPTTRRILVRQ
jgi:hypothetical protein